MTRSGARLARSGGGGAPRSAGPRALARGRAIVVGGAWSLSRVVESGSSMEEGEGEKEKSV